MVVEDVDDLRNTVKQALRLQGFDVVGEACDGETAAKTARATQPEVVVLDLGLPDLAGSELIAQMRLAAPEARIVVYTGMATVDPALLDIDAYVTKDKSVRYLVDLLADIGRTRRLAAIAIGPGVRDVRLARDFLANQCEAWGFDDESGAAQLVMSELVTNALTHGGTHCEMRLRYRDNLLRIEVEDDAPGSPDVRPIEPNSEGGRGLIIISLLSEAWGVDTLSMGGKVVWAELSPERRPEG
jgi:DNA-binding response OmpR family regulator